MGHGVIQLAAAVCAMEDGLDQLVKKKLVEFLTKKLWGVRTAF